MSQPPLPNRDILLEGIAAMAVTLAEMDASTEVIVAKVGEMMLRCDLVTSNDVRDAAAAITRLPQPIDETAEERERRRPIEEMLGVTPPENALLASLRAREVLEQLARTIEAQGS